MTANAHPTGARPDRLYSLIQALVERKCLPHEVDKLEILQTHISCVLLTGPYAYKFKKPVDFGFLDFSTLQKRKYYCEQELRLNRRLAPSLYLEVVTITGTDQLPVLNGSGPAIEYAVKMVQFPQADQLDRLIESDGLSVATIDAIANRMAGFHEALAPAAPDSPYGEPAQIRNQVMQNFEHIAEESRNEPTAARTEHLRTWSDRELGKLNNAFIERKQQGAIRECHGDMHLSNMAMVNGEICIFDCIEFSESLRWIDVISEIAFLLMDLDYRDQPQLMRRLLNHYLELTGDYAGLTVLPFYLAYRSLVRAKVAAILGKQAPAGSAESESCRRRFIKHIDLAHRYTVPRGDARLIITHGLSGSGKTWITGQLVMATDAIRIRSDLERKRLHGLKATQRSGSAVDQGMYTAEVSSRTYLRLAELAGAIIKNGYTVVVDATFLKRSQREAFASLARDLGVPFRILLLQAKTATLEQRIVQRNAEGSDASEASLAVLQRQLHSGESLTEEEIRDAVIVDTDGETIEMDEIRRNIMVV